MTELPFAEATEVVMRFRESKSRLVLAESCTCGMAAALIGGVPGASDVFCGSAVTYREEAKVGWLGVEQAALRRFTAESREVTEQMARLVLQRTPEANWAAAITGHLGPNAPVELDGHVFVSLARSQAGAEDVELIAGRKFALESVLRVPRQIEAAQTLLRWLLAEIG